MATTLRNTVHVFRCLCQPHRIVVWFCRPRTLPHKGWPCSRALQGESQKLRQPVCPSTLASYSEKLFRVFGGMYIVSHVQWRFRDCSLQHADLKSHSVRWYHATVLGCLTKLAVTNTSPNELGFESGTAPPGLSEPCSACTFNCSPKSRGVATGHC